MIYLDWAATSPPDAPALAEGARVAAERFGNPSSKHKLGLEARSSLEEARSSLMSRIAPSSKSKGKLVFTGGGSEADSIALLAVLRQAMNARRDGSIKRLHVVTTEIEHSAVYEQAQLLKSLGLELSLVRPEPDGRVDPAKIAAAVEKDTALVSVMAVNNETGAIQPIAAIAKAIAEASAAFGRKSPRFHVDAVQALGKIAFDPAGSGASSAAYSAHKIRGPRGAGALWIAEGHPIEPLALGGGQEQGLRPGTESLQGAWAFARVAQEHAESFASRVASARELESRLFAGLAAIPGALPLPLGRASGDERYSPFVLSIAFPGLSGEVLVRALSDKGIAVSTGSACSSNAKHAGRRVLEAMGLPAPLALSAIRVSTGELTAGRDIDAFLEAAADAYRLLKT